MRSNLDCEATAASERVLTLVGPSPPVSEAHRGGGEVSLPLEKGWVAPLLTPVTPSPWCYQVLPRGIIMK